jgi:hypothetical protein
MVQFHIRNKNWRPGWVRRMVPSGGDRGGGEARAAALPLLRWPSLVADRLLHGLAVLALRSPGDMGAAGDLGIGAGLGRLPSDARSPNPGNAGITGTVDAPSSMSALCAPDRRAGPVPCSANGTASWLAFPIPPDPRNWPGATGNRAACRCCRRGQERHSSAKRGTKRQCRGWGLVPPRGRRVSCPR